MAGGCLTSKQQPVLAGFLTAEDHEAFTEEETQYLYYLAVLCWMCFDTTYEEMDELNEEDLSIREEQNWNRIETDAAIFAAENSRQTNAGLCRARVAILPGRCIADRC